MILSVALNYGGKGGNCGRLECHSGATQWQGNSGSNHRRTTFHSTSITGDCQNPDLLIRTSGEMRVSNFLLWQIAYAEIFVTETLWPDFNRARFARSIPRFSKPRTSLWWHSRRFSL